MPASPATNFPPGGGRQSLSCPASWHGLSTQHPDPAPQPPASGQWALVGTRTPRPTWASTLTHSSPPLLVTRQTETCRGHPRPARHARERQDRIRAEPQPPLPPDPRAAWLALWPFPFSGRPLAGTLRVGRSWRSPCARAAGEGEERADVGPSVGSLLARRCHARGVGFWSIL